MNAIVKSVSVAALAVVFAKTAFAREILPNDPPPGQLAAGQVVYVACGPGKARKITGGGNIGSGGMAQQGASRQRGPCVPMK